MKEEQTLSLPRAITRDTQADQIGQSREETVSALYETLRPSLLTYAYHLNVSIRDAEDLIQIAFLQLFDHLRSRSDIRNPRGWIFKAVHSLVLNCAGQTARREALIREWLGTASEVDTDTAEEQVMRQQEIEQALGILTERERHCLLLRAEGLSYQEIGDVLDMSAKSVSVYLARGVKKFGARYEENK